MKKKTCSWPGKYLIWLAVFSTSTLAFSPPPENTNNYTPADWQNSVSAEDDAKKAINYNDLRLLGFAGRGFTIPGVDRDQSQSYGEKCGVRYFKEFSDIVRGRDEIELIKKAKEYAIKYNRIIISSCSLPEPSSPEQSPVD